MNKKQNRYIIYISSLLIALFLVVALHGFHIKDLRFGNFIIVFLIIIVLILMELKFIKNKNKKTI